MRTLFLLLLALGGLHLSAKTTLTGVVIDDTSGEPLPYVNVFLEKNQSRGVLTNENGEYSIQLRPDDETDQLVFSLLSYKTHRQPVGDALEAGFFNLRMESSFVSLGEVVVISDLGLRTLMERVFAAIPDNYGADDFLLRAYSRNYQIDDGRYSQFVEGIVNIRDRRYGSGNKKKPGFRTEQFRMERDTAPSLRDRWAVMNGQWQLKGFYNTNIARVGNYTYHRRDLKYLDGITFSNRGEYLNGADTLVRIGYTPSKEYLASGKQGDATDADNTDEDDWWQSGEYLINKSDLAIVRHTLGEAERGHLNEVVYQKVDGKYYPKQVVWYVEFEYENNTRQFIDHQMLYVTEVITGSKNIRKKNKGKELVMGDDLADLRVKYDADFWRENNFLNTLSAPEEMQLTMERMQRTVDALRGKRVKTERDTTK